MEFETRKWTTKERWNVMPAYLLMGFCVFQFIFIGLFVAEAFVAPVIGVDDPPMQKMFIGANPRRY